jgi:hypothetical protein
MTSRSCLFTKLELYREHGQKSRNEKQALIKTIIIDIKFYLNSKKGLIVTY